MFSNVLALRRWPCSPCRRPLFAQFPMFFQRFSPVPMDVLCFSKPHRTKNQWILMLPGIGMDMLISSAPGSRSATRSLLYRPCANQGGYLSESNDGRMMGVRSTTARSALQLPQQITWPRVGGRPAILNRHILFYNKKLEKKIYFLFFLYVFFAEIMADL